MVENLGKQILSLLEVAGMRSGDAHQAVYGFWDYNFDGDYVKWKGIDALPEQNQRAFLINRIPQILSGVWSGIPGDSHTDFQGTKLAICFAALPPERQEAFAKSPIVNYLDQMRLTAPEIGRALKDFADLPEQNIEAFVNNDVAGYLSGLEMTAEDMRRAYIGIAKCPPENQKAFVENGIADTLKAAIPKHDFLMSEICINIANLPPESQEVFAKNKIVEILANSGLPHKLRDTRLYSLSPNNIGAFAANFQELGIVTSLSSNVSCGLNYEKNRAHNSEIRFKAALYLAESGKAITSTPAAPTPASSVPGLGGDKGANLG